MTCIKCTGDTRVIDSSYLKNSVTRKRKCKSCGHIFYTEELRVEEGGESSKSSSNGKLCKT